MSDEKTAREADHHYDEKAEREMVREIARDYDRMEAENARLEAEVAELKRTRKTSEAYLFDAYWNDMADDTKAEVGHWLVERGLLGE